VINAPSTVTVSTGNFVSINPRAGFSYSWSLGGTDTNPLSATGSSVPFTAPSTSQSFAVTCTELNEAGDSSATSEVQLTAVAAPSQPIISIAGLPTQLVAGQSYTASVTATRA